MTIYHYKILAKQIWQRDWFQYQHTLTLIQDHSLYNLSVCTPARQGELTESTMRKDSGRGLYYKVY